MEVGTDLGQVSGLAWSSLPRTHSTHGTNIKGPGVAACYIQYNPSAKICTDVTPWLISVHVLLGAALKGT